MRKFNVQDVFTMSRIIKKANLKEKLMDIMERSRKQNNEEIDTEKVGMDTIFTVLEAGATPEVEKEIYTFLAGVFEMDATEVSMMDLDVLIHNIKELGKYNDLKSFFKKASLLGL